MAQNEPIPHAAEVPWHLDRHGTSTMHVIRDGGRAAVCGLRLIDPTPFGPEYRAHHAVTRGRPLRKCRRCTRQEQR